ncbi:hypothetical protein EVAR_77515_1 [Eumeta japonica]|uniref:Uncharacterized protein n=1 Tax=Eumeta variegata TaxID=151549 RepID=A0A4C1T7B1_EUMVA|nr:hypothetical protein EVAR_77515_1 [Eumeta japonica]
MPGGAGPAPTAGFNQRYYSGPHVPVIPRDKCETRRSIISSSSATLSALYPPSPPPRVEVRTSLPLIRDLHACGGIFMSTRRRYVISQRNSGFVKLPVDGRARQRQLGELRPSSKSRRRGDAANCASSELYGSSSSGNFDVKDEPRSGRPVTDRVDVILEKVKQDRRIRFYNIAEMLGLTTKHFLKEARHSNSTRAL